MTIQKNQLLESLKLCMPGIENGTTTLQGADSFIFHNGNIHSYNDSISVTVPIEQSGLVEENLEGAVKAEEFFKIVSKLPSDEINFTVDDNSWVLKAGKARVEMTLMDFDFDSRLKGIEPSNDWVNVTDEFIQALGTCKMSVNKTPLSGIYVNGKDVVSTDGWQMNKFTMKECELPNFWITDNSVNEILKLHGLCAMQINGTWVHFKTTDGIIFSVKSLLTEKFPYEKINNVLNKSQAKEDDFHGVFPPELFNAIDRAVSFSMDISEHSVVQLTLSKEHIEVFSERISGKYSEKVSWDKDVEEFEPITVCVDSIMMNFVSKHSPEFYILCNEKGQKVLLFKTESSVHLMSTFNKD